MIVDDTGKVPIKMWLDTIEDGALRQARNLARLPFVHKWIAVMPDCHSGYGMPIGGVMATYDVIIPNAVGVDIGCGVIAARTSIHSVDVARLRQVVASVQDRIPVGFTHQKVAQKWNGFDDAPDIPIIRQELDSARRQLGTLGSGNHFIEVQLGDDGFVWLMIHSGSRNLGLKVANVYHKKAQALCARWGSDLPDKDLSFLPMDTPEGKEYFDAMSFCLRFAQVNRECMMERLSECLHGATGAVITDKVNIHHNYAAFEHHYGKNVLVHRKGATKASAGQRGIVPGSMGTASYITMGLGNPESFESCSHGAGRAMGRKEAIRVLSLSDEQKKLGGIVHGMNAMGKLDEAPGAYKNIDAVMQSQKDLVRIVVALKPLASVKG